MAAAPFMEARAMRLAADARIHPQIAKAALAWVDRAVARALADRDYRLAETLGDHAGTIRAIISRQRREEYGDFNA